MVKSTERQKEIGAFILGAYWTWSHLICKQGSGESSEPSVKPGSVNDGGCWAGNSLVLPKGNNLPRGVTALEVVSSVTAGWVVFCSSKYFQCFPNRGKKKTHIWTRKSYSSASDQLIHQLPGGKGIVLPGSSHTRYIFGVLFIIKEEEAMLNSPLESTQALGWEGRCLKTDVKQNINTSLWALLYLERTYNKYFQRYKMMCIHWVLKSGGGLVWRRAL